MRTVIDQVLTPEFLNEAGMKPGTVVDVEVHNGAISIVSADPKSTERHKPLSGKWVGDTANPFESIDKDREDRIEFLKTGNSKVQE